MDLKDKSLQELQVSLEKFSEEKVYVDGRASELPKEIDVLKEKFRKANVRYMNAEGWLEDAVNHLEMAEGRSKQLVGIIDGFKKEIQARKS